MPCTYPGSLQTADLFVERRWALEGCKQYNKEPVNFSTQFEHMVHVTAGVIARSLIVKPDPGRTDRQTYLYLQEVKL